MFSNGTICGHFWWDGLRRFARSSGVSATDFGLNGESSGAFRLSKTARKTDYSVKCDKSVDT
jgi:hypothetical protein